MAEIRAKVAKFQELLSCVQDKKVLAIERLVDDCRLSLSYVEVDISNARPRASVVSKTASDGEHQ